MTSYSVSVQNTLNCSLTPWALAPNTLKLSLKRRKRRENFRSRLRRAEKQVILGSPRGSAPPSGKVPAGAHDACIDISLAMYMYYIAKTFADISDICSVIVDVCCKRTPIM